MASRTAFSPFARFRLESLKIKAVIRVIALQQD
jgi:hypothetical protein